MSPRVLDMLAVFTVFWFSLSATTDEDSNGLNGVLITVYMIKVILNTNKMRFKVCFLQIKELMQKDTFQSGSR